MKKHPIVPMMYYHSITDVHDQWQFRHLSCPVSAFESHLRALRRARFETISLHRLYAYMSGTDDIPERSVVLTFDDGYLDNWVYAYPLLKKYGFQGVIFVTPDFVDPRSSPRPNLDDVWAGRISRAALLSSGFLSWAEMKEMQASGLVDIQSHGLTHTWYFSSAKIVDFHHPGDPYPWLAWNARPERKHLWMGEDQRSVVPWGAPVFEHQKSLATRRYFPDEGLQAALINYVNDRGSEAFFESVGWRERLEEIAREYRHLHGDCGGSESDAEYQARLTQELVESKRIIEAHLDKRVNFLCWPGGGFNDLSLRLAREAGYLAYQDSSGKRGTRGNRYGDDPSRWSRVFPPWYRWSDARYEYKGGLHLVCLLKSVQGSWLHGVVYRSLRFPFKLSQWYASLRRKLRFARSPESGKELPASQRVIRQGPQRLT